LGSQLWDLNVGSQFWDLDFTQGLHSGLRPRAPTSNQYVIMLMNHKLMLCATTTIVITCPENHCNCKSVASFSMHGMFILRLSSKIRGNQQKQNIMGWRAFLALPQTWDTGF
jgi:hypothetical protein